MAFVSTEEFQREGRAVDSEMTSLSEAVDRTTKERQTLGASKVPFPDGPWWQRWQGFYGGWTQYYQEQVRPTPVLPLHDDGDIQQWAKELADWKADFAKGQAQNATAQLKGPLTRGGAPDGSSSSLPGAVKVGVVLAALGLGGYFLSSVGSVKRAFS
jgi:hypothetical protein